MEEISTSFCFICLLHLANEQGLKLESNATDTFVGEEEDAEEVEGAEKSVGHIWDVKVSMTLVRDSGGANLGSRYTATRMPLSLHDCNLLPLELFPVFCFVTPCLVFCFSFLHLHNYFPRYRKI